MTLGDNNLISIIKQTDFHADTKYSNLRLDNSIIDEIDFILNYNHSDLSHLIFNLKS